MGIYMHLIKNVAAIAVLGLTLCSTAAESKEHKIVSVSYTHLTLPTKRIV